MKTITLLLLLLLMGSCTLIVDPAFDPRNQVVGGYQVQEYSETYNASLSYYLTISRSGYGNDIYLENFYNAGIAVRAQFSNSKVYIPLQRVDGYEVEGVGTLYGTSLSLSYKVRDTYSHHAPDFCRTEGWRQW